MLEKRKHSMKKTNRVLGGIAILVLLLASAAYVGGRLSNGQGLPGGGLNVFLGQGGRRQARISPDDILPAKELPQTSAAVRGVFDHRQDNSIFIGTGIVAVGIQRDEYGNAKPVSEHNGPTVEILITSQTKVYEDMTMRQYNDSPPEGQKIQQVVQPGSLDGLGETSTVTVWGRKTGDRIIADVFVYTSPAVIEK